MPKPLTIGKRVANGTLWVVFQALASKAAGLSGQLALAWLLIPQDFGVLAISFAIVQVLSQLQGNGLRVLLVQRGLGIKHWINPVFWLAFFIGIFVCFVGILVGWLYGILAGSWDVAICIWVLSLAQIVNGLTIVPTALLHAEMRFQSLAKAQVIKPIFNAAGSVLLAYVGMGYLSVCIASAVSSVASFMVMWWMVRPPIQPCIKARSWWLIYARALPVQAATVSFMFLSGLPVYILTWRSDAFIVGQYYFAAAIVAQVVHVLAVQLDGVLMPAYVKLRDDAGRRSSAFTLVIAAMSVAVFFAYGLLALVIANVLAVVYGDKWQLASYYTQILVGGSAFLAISIPAGSLMLASGKNSLYFRYSVLALTLAVAMQAIVYLAFGGNPAWVIAGFSISQVVMAIIGLRLSALLVNVRFWVVLRSLFFSAVPVVFGLTVVFILNYTAVEGVALIATMVSLFLIGYFGGLLLLRKIYYRGLVLTAIGVYPFLGRSKLVNLFVR